MDLEIIFTIGTVIAAASVLVAVISGLRADMRDMRADMRAMRADMHTMQAEIRANAVATAELRGALLAHINGHSHPASSQSLEEK